MEHQSGLCTRCRADGWVSGTGNIKKPWPAHIKKRYENWKRWIARKRTYCKKNHHTRTYDRRIKIEVSNHIRLKLMSMTRENKSLDDVLLQLLRADDINAIWLEKQFAAVPDKSQKEKYWRRAL